MGWDPARPTTGCGEGRPLLAGGAGEDVPAVIDKVSLIGSSNSQRAPAVTRPFHVLVTGHPPWADRAHTPRTCPEWCHAMQTTDLPECTELLTLLPTIPTDRSSVHTSWMAWTSTEVQQFTDAEHPAMGHSGMEGRMTGAAPPQGAHPEGAHGTRVMSLGVGTIRTGSGKRPRVTGPECASEGHPVYRILTTPVVCYCVRSARWKSRRPTRPLCSLTHRTTC